MTLEQFLYSADEFAHVRIYHIEDLEKPRNNYDSPWLLLAILPKEILYRKVLTFGIEKADKNKDNTIVIWVIIKEE